MGMAIHMGTGTGGGLVVDVLFTSFVCTANPYVYFFGLFLVFIN